MNSILPLVSGLLPFLTGLLLICGSSLQASDSTWYVREGAQGDGSGKDWENAFPTLPKRLQRGATYYIAGGSYDGYKFDDRPQGDAKITIRKAIEADHGTDEGWKTEYGTTVALFKDTLEFASPHWIFDGQTGGGPDNWRTNFGFKVWTTKTDKEVKPCMLVYADDIVLRHFEAQGNGGGDDNAVGGASNDCIMICAVDRIEVSHAYLHDAGRNLIMGSGHGVTFKYLFGGTFEGTYVQHSEMAAIRYFLDKLPQDWAFYHCIWSHYASTGGIMFQGDGLTVSGNVFYKPAGAEFFGGGGNGCVGTWTWAQATRLKIYNNSFIDMPRAIGFIDENDNGEFRNNIFFRTPVGMFQGTGLLDNSHNHFANIPDRYERGPSGTISVGDPFVDYPHGDFRLKQPLPGGMALESPHDLDLQGQQRGADQGWERGAVEFDTREGAAGE